jgi:hypothetical protein
MISTVAELIAALGGPKTVSGLTGVGIKAISNWKSRGKIAAGHSFVLSNEAVARGLMVDPKVFGMRVPAGVKGMTFGTGTTVNSTR